MIEYCRNETIVNKKLPLLMQLLFVRHQVQLDRALQVAQVVCGVQHPGSVDEQVVFGVRHDLLVRHHLH